MKWTDHPESLVVATAQLGPLFVQIWDYSHDDEEDPDAASRYRVFICADEEDKCHERAIVGEDSYGKTGSYSSIGAAKTGADEEARLLINRMARDLERA